MLLEQDQRPDQCVLAGLIGCTEQRRSLPDNPVMARLIAVLVRAVDDDGQKVAPIEMSTLAVRPFDDALLELLADVQHSAIGHPWQIDRTGCNLPRPIEIEELADQVRDWIAARPI